VYKQVHDISEGGSGASRFSNDFVEKALEQKLNPFESGLPATMIREFGGKVHVGGVCGWSLGLPPAQWQLPQPLHPSIELHHPHPDEHSKDYVCFTLSYRRGDSPQAYRRDVTVRLRDDAVRLVKEINRAFPPSEALADAHFWSTSAKLQELANRVDAHKDRGQQVFRR